MKVVLLIAALTLTTPAVAADDPPPPHVLRVVNDTSAPVNQLFARAGKPGGLKTKLKGIFGTADDDRDRLQAATLSRGGAVSIELDGKRCRYDLRAVLEDGRTYLADGFDVCAAGTWTIASGRQR